MSVSKEVESYVVEQLALVVGLALIALSAHACVAAAVREKPELNGPFALVSSPDGRLFCYVGFGLRVLALDSEGHLLAAWPIPAGGGAARLQAHSDHLEVATIRTDRRLLYTFEGVLISSHDDPAAFDQLQTSHRARLPGGAFAEIRGQALVRVEPTGEEVVLVPPRPWPLTDMPMSSSLIALAAVPGAIGVVFSWVLRRMRLGPAA